MRLTRREFLRDAAVLATLVSGCSRTSERQRVLGTLVRAISVPDTRAILTQCEELRAALQSEQNLQQARVVLRRAALTWQRAYAFRNGPIIETHAFIRSAFWPTRIDAVREVVEGADAIDAKLVEDLGVDIKGMFALEHLLFEGPKSDSECWMLGEHRARARSFALALADAALGYAQRATRALGDGSEFAERFARDPQTSINLLVNQMIGTLETAAARRLDHVVSAYANGNLRMKDVQGAPSGLSTEIPRAWLQTTQRLYFGAGGEGLSKLVANAAPTIDASLRRQFERAAAAMQRIDNPLEQLVTRDSLRIAEAVKAIKELELGLRVDLVSALGVTLTFTASDGD